MSDMKKFIAAKSDQLNSDDLIGSNMIIRITKVRVTETGQQDCTIWFEGIGEKKPWKPAKTMGRVLVAAWGENPQNYVGKYVEITRDAEVIFGGAKVGGIRIVALSDIADDFEIALTISRGFKKPVKIKKLRSTPPPLPEIPAELKTAGLDAVSKGVTEFLKWRDALPQDKKDLMRPFNAMWSAAAKAVDAQTFRQAETTAGAE